MVFLSTGVFFGGGESFFGHKPSSFVLYFNAWVSPASRDRRLIKTMRRPSSCAAAQCAITFPSTENLLKCPCFGKMSPWMLSCPSSARSPVFNSTQTLSSMALQRCKQYIYSIYGYVAKSYLLWWNGNFIESYAWVGFFFFNLESLTSGLNYSKQIKNIVNKQVCCFCCFLDLCEKNQLWWYDVHITITPYMMIFWHCVKSVHSSVHEQILFMIIIGVWGGNSDRLFLTKHRQRPNAEFH